MASIGLLTVDRFAVEEDGLPCDLVSSEQCSHQLRAPRAHQADQAEDLALPEGELDVPQLPGVHALDLEDRLAGCLRPGRVLVLDGPAHHHRDHLVAGDVVDIARGDHVPVPHDRHHVAEAEDLVQLVRDVDDRDALALQVVDDLDELLHLISREAAARLVHDDELRVEGQRLGDLDHLLVRDAQFRHQPVGIDLGPDALQQGLGPWSGRPPARPIR